MVPRFMELPMSTMPRVSSVEVGVIVFIDVLLFILKVYLLSLL
jgi:hypothetical protein